MFYNISGIVSKSYEFDEKNSEKLRRIQIVHNKFQK